MINFGLWIAKFPLKMIEFIDPGYASDHFFNDFRVFIETPPHFIQKTQKRYIDKT